MAVVLGQYADDVKLQSRQNIYDHSTRTDNVWSWAYEHYEFSDEADVLEVGCGNGVFWDVCGSATEDLSLTLTDISPGMLKAAATKLSMHPKINFELADIQALQFKDASFDTVLAHYMLYHVDDLTVAFSEIKRVLRRNGFLGVLLPDNAHLSTISMRKQRRRFCRSTFRIYSTRCIGIYCVSIMQMLSSLISNLWLTLIRSPSLFILMCVVS